MKLKVFFYRLQLPAVLFAVLFLLCAPLLAATNAITLSVDPNPAKVKEKVTLTANVRTNNKAATGGTVTFFDSKIPLSSAQVVGKNPAKGYKTGMATLTLIMSPGAHSLTAVYGGTAGSPKLVRSKPVALKVTGKTGSATVLTAKANVQHPKNYDFTATVSGFGLAVPQNKVDFTDITANTDLGTAPLDSKTASHSFGKALVTSASGAADAVGCCRFQWRRFPRCCHGKRRIRSEHGSGFPGQGEWRVPIAGVLSDWIFHQRNP